MAWIEWKDKLFGSAAGFEYKEGRTVLHVRPDMDGRRWYWSVFWPKHTAPPKKEPNGSQWIGGGVVPARTVWGTAPTADEAKKQAQLAFGRGRNQS